MTARRYASAMSLSTYAFIIGFAPLLLGIPQFLFPERTTAWLFRALEEDVLMRFVGLLFFLLSFLVLRTDYTVGTDIAGLVRLMAWLITLKSLVLCYAPAWRARIVRRFLAPEYMHRIYGLFALGWGVLLLIAAEKLGG